MSNQAGQGQSGAEVDTAGQSGPTSTEAPEIPGGEPQAEADTPADDDGQDHDDDTGQDGDDTGGTGGRRSREAGLRRRAQAAEAEVDQLRGQLTTLRRQVVEDIAADAGVDPRLLIAAGHDMNAFIGEDGTVDRAAVAAACASAAAQFRVPPRPRRPAPNPQQGGGSPPIGGRPLRDVIDKALKR